MFDDQYWGCAACGTEYEWDDYPFCVQCKTGQYFEWLNYEE